ncbi:MAG: hypothetical protein AMXMBFR48_07160 [Ignavibacteriales bacterium]
MKYLLTIFLVLTSLLRAGGFEDLGISARVKSLGGAGIALHGAPYLQFFNSASVAYAENYSVSASYSNLYPDVEGDNLNYLSLAGLIPLPYIGKFGAGINMLNTDLWKEYVIQAGYGIEILPRLTVGGAVKFLGWSANAAPGEDALSYVGLTFDAGAIYTFDEPTGQDALSLGLSIKNLTNPSIAQNGSSDASLPISIGVGSVYHSKKYEYLILTDVVMEDDVIGIRFGAEFLSARYSVFGYNNDFFIRGGYNNLLSADFARESGLSGGFGLNVETVKIDYAYIYPLELKFVGGSHKMTVTYNF